jgi:hypothetical protein
LTSCLATVVTPTGFEAYCHGLRVGWRSIRRVAADNARPLPITSSEGADDAAAVSKALIAANASVEFTKGKKPGVITWLLSKDALEPREPEKIVQSPFGTSRLDVLLVLGVVL